MGNAEPADSPPASAPDGEVVEFAAVTDMELTRDVLGVVSEGSVKIGSLEDIRNGSGASYEYGSACGDLTANAGKFVGVCNGTVRVFDEKSETSFTPKEPVTVAAMLSDGRVIAGSSQTEKVWIYPADASGEAKPEKSFPVARPSDFVVAGELPQGWKYAGKEGGDAVVRVNRFDTTIQDLQPADARQGGTLRVGLGVGQVAAGREGLVLASDTTGNQLFVYTTDEVIRLHQTVPTQDSPFAVAWDNSKSLAWAASTATNTAAGYDLSHGVPRATSSIATVANARNMVILDDGTIVVASFSGDGLQIIAPDQVHTSSKEK
ncbi:hypothetical protein [Corynebacterium aquatimens]|uniref:Prolipoprotein LppL n=1 Tax=Corynebacterium aquatimens TaxID=1190508 RepID=A0A931DZM5_9CORY|nr:hypothetical protein [Corynebacterium aquatimens]MBG6121613.1 hypothetical protein [Corynebacterium aquatimens]WJY65847.1 hypothetical protein CAQUA_05700 [Corynebacterium aquatimens]